MKRGRPLRQSPARIEGSRLSSQGAAGHPMAGLSQRSRTQGCDRDDCYSIGQLNPDAGRSDDG